MNYHFVLNNNFKKQTNQHIFLKKREKSNQKNSYTIIYLPKTNQKACRKTGHEARFLSFSAFGSRDIVENAEEDIDEIDI